MFSGVRIGGIESIDIYWILQCLKHRLDDVFMKYKTIPDFWTHNLLGENKRCKQHDMMVN